MSVSREQFKFRFSPHKLRDIQLSQWVAADIEAGINVSEIAKDLLYAHYVQRQNGDGLVSMAMSALLPGSAVPEDDPVADRDDPLVQKMRGLSSSFSSSSFAGK